MSDDNALTQVHPEGEPQIEGNQPAETPLSLDTFAGKVQFRWVPDAEVSSLGQMPFFIEYLKTSGVFENWVNDCPLQYSCNTVVRMRRRFGMCWGRYCYRCWRGTGGMRISAPCAAMESIPGCWE